MKKLALLLMISSAVCILFSSCSLSITKRHYRSGYYVDLGSHKPASLKPKVAKTIELASTDFITGVVELPSAVSQKQQTPVPTDVDLMIHAQKKKQHSTGNIYASSNAYSITNDNMLNAASENYFEPTPYPVSASSRGSSSSAPMWVIVLFAILIPPLGVFLRFGIIDKFWISLLLTLIFWLPGAIYSVIVVTE